MKCYIFWVILTFLCFANGLNAQKAYNELGFTVGYSYYVGDINPYRHMGPNKNIGAGIVFKNNFNPRQALRFHGLWTRLKGNDADNSDPLLVNRNLNFQSDILEAAIILEINFYDYIIGDKHHAFSPFLYGGLSYFHMNPKSDYQGNLIELQPLSTEGQGNILGPEPYSLNQLAIPFGFGVKANLGGRAALSAEFGPRKTMTDYIDDVSTVYANPGVVYANNGIVAVELSDPSLIKAGPNGTNEGLARGNPENNDWYYYTGFSLTFRLGPKDLGCWK